MEHKESSPPGAGRISGFKVPTVTVRQAVPPNDHGALVDEPKEIRPSVLGALSRLRSEYQVTTNVLWLKL